MIFNLLFARVVTYNIEGVSYTTNIIAEHSVEKSYFYLYISIGCGIIILIFVIYKLSRKKKKRTRNYRKNRF